MSQTDRVTPEVIDAPAPPPPARALRVVTFNVEFRTQAEPLVEVLRSHAELASADVLLLQECEAHPGEGASRAARIARALGLGGVYAPARTARVHGTYGLAILSRWPLADVEVVELPRMALPFGGGRRIALAGVIATEAGPVRVTSVHLDTRINAAARIAQLAPAVAGSHARHIVGGDMNTLPFVFAGNTVPVLPSGQARRLEAYVRGLGFDTPLRELGRTHRNVVPMRLDALYTRGVVVTGARIVRDVRLSDHYPAWIDVRL